MDQIGSLIDTNIRIYPSKKLLEFLKTLSGDHLTQNILRVLGKVCDKEIVQVDVKAVQINDKDYDNLTKIKRIVKEKFDEFEPPASSNENLAIEDDDSVTKSQSNIAQDKDISKKLNSSKENENTDSETTSDKEGNTKRSIKREDPYLLTTDLQWLYLYLKECRHSDENVPYLHELIEDCDIEMPDNKIIKRNPILEARCVKLRAQQEAREYRKMTKTVDNVRIRFPEDSISYQMKQLNRQLIAIGQFLLSIFAGFLFGFRGVEWMVGNLDFGFRLLLGVMCALVIALAEIYFLAKKLNEELNVPETVQLGGPPKFAENSPYANTYNTPTNVTTGKEHQD